MAAALAFPAAAMAEPARIAFQSGDDIATVNADGSGRATLLHVPGRYAGQPAWSPDGARLALSVWGDETLPRIYTMGADGSGLQQVTRAERRTTLDATPRWSPDGRRIAFVRWTFGDSRVTSRLMTVAPDGSDQQTVVLERLHGFDRLDEPAWSPDGSRIVYSRYVRDATSNYRPELWSVAPGGTDRRRLARDAAAASFSPDGSRIAYVSVADRNGKDCGESDCTFHGEIYAMNADGTGRRRLTNSRADDSAPAWSPDGGHIVYASDRNYPDSQELYSVTPDGACSTWITNGAPDSSAPAWQPGAGRSSDAGACGPTPRPALVTTDISGALAFTAAPVYWVGPTALERLLLSAVEPGSSGVRLVYDDCSEYFRENCPKDGFELYNAPVCRQGSSVLYGLRADGLTRLRGALLYRSGDPYDGATVFAGATVIFVGESDRGRLRALTAELRPVGAAAPPRLPAPGLPHAVWRPLDRVAALQRRLRSTRAVARRLHRSPRHVRNSLAVRRRLEALGVRRLGC